jgi:signal transduction histidine kinase
VDTGLAKDDSQRVKEGWDAVKTIASRVRKLVFDILYFAKDRDLELESVTILNFANDVAASFEAKARDRGVDFRCDFTDVVCEIELDPGVMRLALFNLLDNALDACLETGSPKNCRIGFGLKVDQKKVVFKVTDNGIGMGPETLEKLFTLFFSSKGEKGTGMGLFIADKIISQHGGNITVQSSPGKGSVFEVILPARASRPHPIGNN